LTSPDQDDAVLIDGEALALDEFVLQIVQGCVVELELPLERAVGQVPTPLEHGYRLVEDLLKGHRHPSLCRCGVQKTVRAWEKPVGLFIPHIDDKRKAEALQPDLDDL